jgi:hypothetical protein
LISAECVRRLLAQKITANEKNSTHYGSETEWANIRTLIETSDLVMRNSKYAGEKSD